MFSLKLIAVIAFSVFASSPEPFLSPEKVGPVSKGHAVTFFPGDNITFPWFELFRTRFLKQSPKSDSQVDFRKLVKRVGCSPLLKTSMAVASFPFGSFDFYSNKEIIEYWQVPPISKGYPIGEYEFIFTFYGRKKNPKGNHNLLFQDSFTVNITAFELLFRLEVTFLELDSTLQFPFAIYNDSSVSYRNISIVLLKWSSQNPYVYSDSGELVHYGIYHVEKVEPSSRLSIEDFFISRGDKPGMIDINEHQGYYYLMAFTSIKISIGDAQYLPERRGIPLAYSAPIPIKSISNKSKFYPGPQDNGLFITPNSNTVQHCSSPTFLIRKNGARNVIVNTDKYAFVRKMGDESTLNDFNLSITPFGNLMHILSEGKQEPKLIVPGRYSLAVPIDGTPEIKHPIRGKVLTNFISSIVLHPTANSTFLYDEEITIIFVQSFGITKPNSADSFLFLGNLRVELAIPNAIYLPREGDFMGPHHRVLESVACINDSDALFTFNPEFMTLEELERLTRSGKYSGTAGAYSTVSLSVRIRRGAIPAELEGQSVFLFRIRADCYEFGLDVPPPQAPNEPSKRKQTDPHNSRGKKQKKKQSNLRFIGMERNVVLAETPEFVVAHPDGQLQLPGFFRFPRWKEESAPIIPKPFPISQYISVHNSFSDLSSDLQENPSQSNLAEERGREEIISSEKAKEIWTRRRRVDKITLNEESPLLTSTNYLPRPSRPVLIAEQCSSSNGICAQLLVKPKTELLEFKNPHEKSTNEGNCKIQGTKSAKPPVQKVLLY